MTILRILCVLALAAFPAAAQAYDFSPVPPLDTGSVDPAMMTDIYGAWEIRDRSGKKRCRFELLKDAGIGGYQIEVAQNCARVFPIMGDISAWRLLEGWGIDLVDPLRKVRLRFTTPDARYVAFGDRKDIAGMDELVKLNDKPKKK